MINARHFLLQTGRNIALFLPFCMAVEISHAQRMKQKVLFIGNSFTATNDLPGMTAKIASSTGDTLIHDMNAPGGYTFKQHTTNGATISKISKGDWNYVVLQEQSQRPAFPDAQVSTEVTPYARMLDSLVHDKNTCGRSVFYMTWGYPDGDPGNCPFFTPLCTYKGMDSLLNLRYSAMAIGNNALLSPVGQVFNELMKTAPGINLFAADRIHPSIAGTYAAGLTFYTLLFRKDPLLVSYNSSLSSTDADKIKAVVATIVFKALSKWHAGKYDPKAGFTTSLSGSLLSCNSSASVNVTNYYWDFGDGSSSSLPNPVHTYIKTGNFTVTLIGTNCTQSDSFKQEVSIRTSIIEEATATGVIKLYPNPAHTIINIETNGTGSRNDLWVKLTDRNGTEVLRTQQTGPVSVSHLANGIYFIHLMQASAVLSSGKFIKE